MHTTSYESIPFRGIMMVEIKNAPAMVATSRGVTPKGLASMCDKSTPRRSPELWEYTCQTCGERFTITARRARQRIRHNGYPPTYCSNACRNARERKAQVPFTCEHCGDSFTTYRSEVRKAEARGERVKYCSVACRKAASAVGNSEHVCEVCGVIFTLWASQRRYAESRGWTPGRFCSSACYEQYREQYRVEQAERHGKPCEVCRVPLTIRDGERASVFRRRRTCSPDCQYRLMMTTRLGRKPGQRIYPKAFSVALKEMIRDRDGFACQECGVIENGRAHDVHHIDYDKHNCHPNNLITLCRSCHARTNQRKRRGHWVDHYRRKMKARVVPSQ